MKRQVASILLSVGLLVATPALAADTTQGEVQEPVQYQNQYQQQFRYQERIQDVQGAQNRLGPRSEVTQGNNSNASQYQRQFQVQNQGAVEQNQYQRQYRYRYQTKGQDRSQTLSRQGVARRFSSSATSTGSFRSFGPRGGGRR